MLALPYQMDRPLEAQKETNSLLPRAFPEVFEMAHIVLVMFVWVFEMALVVLVMFGR